MYLEWALECLSRSSGYTRMLPRRYKATCCICTLDRCTIKIAAVNARVVDSSAMYICTNIFTNTTQAERISNYRSICTSKMVVNPKPQQPTDGTVCLCALCARVDATQHRFWSATTWRSLHARAGFFPCSTFLRGGTGAALEMKPSTGSLAA